MEKYGAVFEDTKDDFGGGRIRYMEKNGFLLADEQNKGKLQDPVEIKLPEKPKA